jgi:hypothetical protein
MRGHRPRFKCLVETGVSFAKAMRNESIFVDSC